MSPAMPAKQWNHATMDPRCPRRILGLGVHAEAGRPVPGASDHGSSREMAQAAPYPLSMPTTAIPDEQLDSMASRAVTPSTRRRSRCWSARRPPVPGSGRRPRWPARPPCRR